MRIVRLLALAVFLTASATSAAPPDLSGSLRGLREVVAASGRESASARLARFSDLYWNIRLQEFPDQAAYAGVKGFAGRWPDFSAETVELIHRTTREELAALSSIDRSALAPSEQIDYDLARRRLETRIEGERFHDLEPFRNEYLLIDPLGGIDQDLLGQLGSLPARTMEDYDNLLTLLRGFPTAVDQTIAQLDKGLALGITPPRVTLRGVADRVGGLLSDDPWKSPVLQPFATFSDTIPPADRERFRNAAVQIYEDQVAPAVRKLRDYLAGTYVPRARESIAMSELPDGAAWYAFQLRSLTTTSLTPEEIHQLGLSEVHRIRQEMDTLITAVGFQGSFTDFSRFLRTDPRFFFDRPEDLLKAYRDLAKRIDPELVKLFGRLPRLTYGVKAMEGEAAKTAPAGYYSNGALEAGMPAWFLVNTDRLETRPKWEMEALTLHEAVPGHHLQYALAAEEKNLPEWRKRDVYPVFSEGWALYAESLGSELGLYQDPYSKFGRLTNEVWRAIRLVADTGLHAKGWTRQQAIDYYRANCAKTDHDIEVEVDRIIAQPGTVPVYKLGELKIRELRDFAQKELRARFDLRAFHDQVLGHGQLPLDLLETSIKSWVDGVELAP